MKWTIREAIAVTLSVVVVVGFAYLFMFDNVGSGSIVNSDTGDQRATPLSGFQQLIEQGNTELVSEDLVVGDGDAAESGDTLVVHYVGILTDGTQFDSSVERGEPFTFTLGTGGVIAGWDQGLSGMREGGRRVLIIPPSLGYGERSTGSIPANSTLIFEVLLLDIQ